MRWLSNDGKLIDVSTHMDDLCTVLRGTPGLVASYLYGSYGTPMQTPLSDIDLAVIFEPKAVPSLEQESALQREICAILRQEDVSVTVLNRSPVVFRFCVLKTGRLLVCNDRPALADFIEKTLIEHGDWIEDYERFVAEYDKALLERYSHAH